MSENVFQESLPCRLSPQEVTERGRQLAEKRMALGLMRASHEAELEEQKQRKKAMEADELNLDRQIGRLAQERSTGLAHKPVDVQWRTKWSTKEMELYRLDTKERVRSRSMRDDEIRRLATRELPLAKPAAKKKPAAKPAAKKKPAAKPAAKKKPAAKSLNLISLPSQTDAPKPAA